MEYGILYEDGRVFELATSDLVQAKLDLEDIKALFVSDENRFPELAGATLMATDDDRLTWYEVTL